MLLFRFGEKDQEKPNSNSILKFIAHWQNDLVYEIILIYFEIILIYFETLVRRGY